MCEKFAVENSLAWQPYFSNSDWCSVLESWPCAVSEKQDSAAVVDAIEWLHAPLPPNTPCSAVAAAAALLLGLAARSTGRTRAGQPDASFFLLAVGRPDSGMRKW